MSQKNPCIDRKKLAKISHVCGGDTGGRGAFVSSSDIFAFMHFNNMHTSSKKCFLYTTQKATMPIH